MFPLTSKCKKHRRFVPLNGKIAKTFCISRRAMWRRSPYFPNRIQYLEALDREVKKQTKNPSVVVILCASKDDEVVEFALSRSLLPTMVSEYRLRFHSIEYPYVWMMMLEMLNIQLNCRTVLHSENCCMSFCTVEAVTTGRFFTPGQIATG